MSQHARDLLSLFALGLVINGAVAALIASPGYTDAYYYANGASWFVRGGPLVEPYLWNYVVSPPSLPAPAFAYWQPLPSMLAALGMMSFPWMQPFDAAQIPFVVLAAVLPLISYAVGSRLGERRHGLLGGLLSLFSGYYVIYGPVPETFTPFAVAGSGALALAGSGRATSRWWVWLLTGIAAGLAHLTRADGILLIGIVGFVALLPTNHTDWRDRLGNAALAMLGYLIVMGPWFARNLAVLGSATGPGGLSTIWLIEYNDMFLYRTPLTPERYLAAGWGVIMQGKLRALLSNLATFVGVQNLVFLTPLTLIGVWRRWRQPWLLPSVLYGAALFAAMTLVFTWPGLKGGWFHSGAALMPFIVSAAAVGLDDAIRWMARRRAGWNPAQARRVFSAGAVILAAAVTVWLVLSGVIGLPFSGRIGWNERDAAYREIGAALEDLDVPPDAPVMVNNPPGFYWHTGHGGVPLPSGDEAMLLDACDDFGISYLVVDRHVADPLWSLYSNGPASDRLVTIGTFGSPEAPVYLYRNEP